MHNCILIVETNFVIWKGQVNIMSKIAVVYWSMTGNTELMAESVVEGAKSAGAEVDLIRCEEFTSEKIADYDAFAFGCPAMGSESLEEEAFQPMWDSVKKKLDGKKVAFFGSYNWNDGEWMRDWQEEADTLGLNRVVESIISYDDPDADVKKQLESMGSALI